MTPAAEESGQLSKAVGKTETHPVLNRSSKKRTREFQPDTQTFHGVRRRSWGRYVSEIRLPGQKTRVWLGSFESPEMAARAYDSAAFFLKGSSASLNFPDSVGSLPRPESTSRRDIQAAAAKAAAAAANNNNNNNNNNTDQSSETDVLTLPSQLDLSIWLGMEECCYCEIGTASFEEVKEAPLLSPLRFNVAGELMLCSCYMPDLLTSSLNSYA